MTTKIEAWVKDADQGSRFVYHRGAHAGGEECRAAMELHEKGLVLLVRKRGINKRLFDYIAHRTGKKL